MRWLGCCVVIVQRELVVLFCLRLEQWVNEDKETFEVRMVCLCEQCVDFLVVSSKRGAWMCRYRSLRS